MAYLKTIEDKDGIEGYYENNEIGINVQYMWERSQRIAEQIFIKHFCDTYTHELLHMLIYKLHPDKKHRDDYLYEEEKTIYAMMGERCTKDVDKFYKKFYSENEQKKIR